MYSEKILSFENLENFDFNRTKKNIINYFKIIEKLQWELAKITAQNGLVVKIDFSTEYQKQPYTPVGTDIFNLSIKEQKQEQLKKYLYSYYWAKSVLSDKEQLYIEECFVHGKYEDEIIDLLGFYSANNRDFRELKRSAVYKFADFLNLLSSKC